MIYLAAPVVYTSNRLVVSSETPEIITLLASQKSPHFAEIPSVNWYNDVSAPPFAPKVH